MIESTGPAKRVRGSRGRRQILPARLNTISDNITSGVAAVAARLPVEGMGLHIRNPQSAFISKLESIRFPNPSFLHNIEGSQGGYNFDLIFLMSKLIYPIKLILPMCLLIIQPGVCQRLCQGVYIQLQECFDLQELCHQVSKPRQGIPGACNPD